MPSSSQAPDPSSTLAAGRPNSRTAGIPSACASPPRRPRARSRGDRCPASSGSVRAGRRRGPRTWVDEIRRLEARLANEAAEGAGRPEPAQASLGERHDCGPRIPTVAGNGADANRHTLTSWAMHLIGWGGCSSSSCAPSCWSWRAVCRAMPGPEGPTAAGSCSAAMHWGRRCWISSRRADPAPVRLDPARIAPSPQRGHGPGGPRASGGSRRRRFVSGAVQHRARSRGGLRLTGAFGKRVAVLGPRQLGARIDARPELRLAMPSLLGLRDLDGLIAPELGERSSLDRRAAADLAAVFVPTRAYRRALSVLAEHRFAVLTGPPEMGKTAAARMIALAQLTSGWEAHECTSPEDVWRAFDADRAQVFIADDAFGSTEYRADAAERWARAMERLLRSLDHRHWLIWTSRPAPLRPRCGACIASEAPSTSRLRPGSWSTPEPSTGREDADPVSPCQGGGLPRHSPQAAVPGQGDRRRAAFHA